MQVVFLSPVFSLLLGGRRFFFRARSRAASKFGGVSWWVCIGVSMLNYVCLPVYMVALPSQKYHLRKGCSHDARL